MRQSHEWLAGSFHISICEIEIENPHPCRIRKGAAPGYCMLANYFTGLSSPFRLSWLSLNISRDRSQLLRSAYFKLTVCGPAGNFRVSGAFPTNFPSRYTSAPSGSEETVTVPNPSMDWLGDELGAVTIG